MKRIVSIILVAAVMLFSVVGCGSLEGRAYVFKCVDSSGNPIQGVSLQVCSDTQCMLFNTDEKGEAVCSGIPKAAYEVHVSKCPEGYSYDKEDVYTTSNKYETHTFTLTSN